MGSKGGGLEVGFVGGVVGFVFEQSNELVEMGCFLDVGLLGDGDMFGLGSGLVFGIEEFGVYFFGTSSLYFAVDSFGIGDGLVGGFSSLKAVEEARG